VTPPPLAIQKLVKSRPDRGKVDAFLAVKDRTFPLIEGPHATFVWRGEADKVSLRHWIFGLESEAELQRVPNTDLWYLTMDVPHGSRVEYKFEIHFRGGSQWIEDPQPEPRA